MSFSLTPTADGSLSCVDSITGQLSHNRAGAYTEALEHYTRSSGILDLIAETGRAQLLDACYGMGYNTWVLVNELLKIPDQSFALSVTAIETSVEVINFLPRILEHPAFDPLNSKTGPFEHNTYYRTFRCKLDTMAEIDSVTHVEPVILLMDFGANQSIEIRFYLEDIRRCLPRLDSTFDLVFHDPFSPQKVPELWTVDLFREYARMLSRPHGRLLTYSAAAAVRGGLREAGFVISKTPTLGQKSGGTAGRFEGTEWGLPLTVEEEAYLETRSSIPYRDPGFCQSREQILAARDEELTHSSQPSGSKARELLRSRGNYYGSS